MVANGTVLTCHLRFFASKSVVINAPGRAERRIHFLVAGKVSSCTIRDFKIFPLVAEKLSRIGCK